MAETKSHIIPLWISIFVVVSALAFFAIGYMGAFNLEALTGFAPSDDAQRHASFMAGRQFVLAIALVGLLLVKEVRALGYLLVVMGFIQLYDAGLNISMGQVAGETFMMGLLTVLNFFSAYKLLSITKR